MCSLLFKAERTFNAVGTETFAKGLTIILLLVNKINIRENETSCPLEAATFRCFAKNICLKLAVWRNQTDTWTYTNVGVISSLLKTQPGFTNSKSIIETQGNVRSFHS